ncbi:uncharacterized protein CELE_ZK973.4 [Caenorhabditis elegans]|uniref:Uncharacterized protein n=1 Tax=Caenorhabditis elegans TaxID=6239 RepID=Q9N4M2_CAEEL|nr:Uncharacterized protein CELE_ZK973.4 [Caenorhabditis elegans]CCD73566.1 Uncharacterized protein CELE_ZK973.4 [Caenorhabditis elegans]|eukprot:NP_491355.1 Uncharacterized protein CELE_ZK973.4 [Caenorhabditis elegans]
MNVCFAFRLLIDFLVLAWILTVTATQCVSKRKIRKVDKERGRGRRMRGSRNKDEKSPPNEEHLEYTAIPPSPATSSIKKSTRKERTEMKLQSTQNMPTESTNQASTTQQLCPTQEDDFSAQKQATKPKKTKKKEEFFEDQDDDDTLGCIKSIEN